MNDLTCPEGQGRASLANDAQACGHDCNNCLGDFEQTQQQAEQLRVALLHEQAAQQQLWQDAREAMRQALNDLLPASRAAGTRSESDEFRRGWEQCRAEVEYRVQALVKIL